MRISHKSRLTTLVGAAALVVASLSSVPANAAAAGPLCDAKVPVNSCQGTTSDGAPYACRFLRTSTAP